MNKYISKGTKPTRQGFGEALAEQGDKDSRIVVIGADVTGSVLTSFFAEKHPERFISVGIAEQNATTIAVGLALSGKVAFFSAYAAFATFRNADQLRVSVCYNNANVKIAGGHSGVTVGPDGATHQCLEDIGLLRTLPNMTIVVPCDYEQAKKATIAVAEHIGPAYIRLSRAKTAIFTNADDDFQIGKADVLRDGTDVCIVACGALVWEALQAAGELETKYNLNVAVINCHTIKPIDADTISAYAKKCGAIVTAEEHQIYGGLGSAVAEVVVGKYPVPMEMIAMQDRFGESGEPDELMRHFGFTAENIVNRCLLVHKRKIEQK
ncbi:MAG: transketolase family protein [Ignavibacteria bacterium]|jgi:transketolase|nr:transketolase family protein [Ignavibacteria bacterium]